MLYVQPALFLLQQQRTVEALTACLQRERERERERKGRDVVTGTSYTRAVAEGGVMGRRRQSIILLEVSQVSPARPSGTSIKKCKGMNRLPQLLHQGCGDAPP